MLTVVVIVGKIVGVTVGAFLTGSGTRTSVQAGMSLAQIGEFSFIIAGLGLALGATGDFLYPVAVAVSAITTLTTPWLIRAAEPVAELRRPQAAAAAADLRPLYGSWLERLRDGRRPRDRRADVAALLAAADRATLRCSARSSWRPRSGSTQRPALLVATCSASTPMAGRDRRDRRGVAPRRCPS